MKTKIEIIDETIAYYKTHPRAMAASFCSYFNNVGDMCAVGRCMNTPEKLSNVFAPVCDFSEHGLSLDDELKPEYRGHETYFWREVQKLHDADVFWDNPFEALSTLNELGRSHVKRLKNEYK